MVKKLLPLPLLAHSLLAQSLLAPCLLALAACDDGSSIADRQLGPNPPLPAVRQYLFPPMHIAKVAKWGSDKPSVPAGLTVQALATGFQHPRQLYVLPNGDVLVVETSGPTEPVSRPKSIVVSLVQGYGGSREKGAQRITLIRDADGDGRPELRSVFLDHLVSPFGVALVGNDLYVANTDAVVRYPYVAGQTRITARGTKLADLPGGPIDHHWTKDLVASPDGTKLYVGVGSNSNVTENGMEAEKGRAAIYEIDRATGAERVYASGLRNPTSLDFNPANNQLWAVANERDELGPDLVPDYLTSVRENAFYGWPYSYWGQHLDPRVKPQRPDLVAKAIPPDYSLSSHAAPLGLQFYRGGSLGAQFAGGAFVGEHGSWDRSRFNGYKVVFVPFRDGRPAGLPRDVVTGFVSGDSARGRPVGLAVDRTGALLVADDLGNTVWRVSAAARVAAR